MGERTVSLEEAQAHLGELIASGDEVTVTKRGIAVAAIVPRPTVRTKLDLDWLRRMTADMPMGEDSLPIIRQMRDDARY